MMTIKHITNGGHERVVSAVSVSYDKDKNELTGYGTPEGTAIFKDGAAYVMNDNGNTVAVYNFRAGKM